MKIKTSKADVIWNYLGTAFSLGSSFVLLPFLVEFLSGEELGLWYVYLAIGSMIVLFEFGFSPTFARNVAYCWSGARILTREGRGEICSGESVDGNFFALILAVCRDTYRGVSAIAAVTLAGPCTLYVLVITHMLDLQIVLISWFVFAAAALINLYYLYYSALLRGIGKVAADNKIKVISRSVQLVLSIVLLFAGIGVLAPVFGYAANTVVFRICTNRAFWKDPVIQSMGIEFSSVPKGKKQELRKTISYNARRDGVVQLSNYIATQAATIMCSLYLGLAEAASFSIALQFATALGTFSLSYINSFRPMMQSSYQQGNENVIRRMIGEGCIAYLTLYLVGAAGIVCVAYPLLVLMRSSVSFDPLVFVAVAAYMFLFDWHSLFASVLSNMNRIDYMLAYFISSIAGIFLGFLFTAGLKLGVWGLILGIALPQLVYNNWKWPQAATIALGTSVREELIDGMKIWKTRLRLSNDHRR